MYSINIEYSFDYELPLYEYKQLNGVQGVYFMYDWNGELAYIGKSVDIGNRFYNHTHLQKGNSNLGEFIYLIKDFKVILVDDLYDTNLLEQFLIDKYKPHLNIQYVERKESINNYKHLNNPYDYKDRWNEEILTRIKQSNYNRTSNVLKLVHEIAQIIDCKKLKLPITLSGIGNKQKTYLNKHYKNHKEMIDNILREHGYEIIYVTVRGKKALAINRWK